MSGAIATLRLTPSALMAFRDLVLEYVVAKEQRAHLEPRTEWIDVVNDVTTTPEQLLELLAAVNPQPTPANTFTSVELDAMLERVEADERKRVEFERRHTHGAVVALDGGSGGPARAPAGLDLAAPCHQGAPMFARYSRGVLEMRCAVCNARTANVQVGP